MSLVAKVSLVVELSSGCSVIRLPRLIAFLKFLDECFGGALVWDDFVQICRKIGFLGPFIVQSYPYRSTIPELIEATSMCFFKYFSITFNFLEDLDFVARTVRLFKPDGTKNSLKPQLTYIGGILGSEEELMFDLEHRFKVNFCIRISVVHLFLGKAIGWCVIRCCERHN